eukprot:3925712-Prymnesium_polylepis.1
MAMDGLKKAAEFRRVLGSCARCALRFAALRDPNLYAAPDAELEERLAAATPGGAAAPEGAEASSGAAFGACALCIGCLESCVSEESIATLAARATAEGYEMRSFTIAVSVP